MLSTSNLEIPDIKYNSSILSTIGNTPMIRLSRISNKHRFSIFGKMESFNPGGSIKDRTAQNMLSEAIESGEVKPGDTVIESSSGNMAIGLAQACKFYGLKLIVVSDPKLNSHSERILLAYGARVEKIYNPKSKGGFLESRLQKVEELLKTYPDSHCLNQYENLANPQTHLQTMKEISEALEHNVDFIFISTSTCGTLMGCAQYILEKGLRTKIVAVDAVGSVTFGQDAQKRLIPGHGSGKPSNFLNEELVQAIIHVSDVECVQGCWDLLEKESILCGGSSGAVITAIKKHELHIPDGSNCVAILCDRGERYLDTIFNREWIKKHFPNIELAKSPDKELISLKR